MRTDSAKSRRLEKLVRKSYDINAEYTDSDAAFIEKAIEQEEDALLVDLPTGARGEAPRISYQLGQW